MPEPVGEALGVGAGDRVRYVILGNEVRVLPVCPVGRLLGALKHDGPSVTPEDMEHAIAEGASEGRSGSGSGGR